MHHTDARDQTDSLRFHQSGECSQNFADAVDLVVIGSGRYQKGWAGCACVQQHGEQTLLRRSRGICRCRMFSELLMALRQQALHFGVTNLFEVPIPLAHREE